MSLIQLDINHDIADGNLVSSALQIDANQASILAKFTDIPTSDVVVSLEQSLDAVNYTPVPDSSKTLDFRHELHQWNVTGLVAGDRGYRQRLLAMGLTPGAVLEVRRKAPLGDPVEISVRNFTLTLRKSEAAILELEAV